MNSLSFTSRTKLLLSGEYLVMSGADALAIPLSFGQRMDVSETSEPGLIRWETSVQNASWFSAEYRSHDLSVSHHNNTGSSNFIQKLLRAAQELNPNFLNLLMGYQVQCHLDFKPDWGLGSSSSLISNVAWWADVDPLSLHFKVSEGSGYDVACARAVSPIIYQLNEGKANINPVDFYPNFHRHIYFVYLGQKKDSQAEVATFKKGKSDFATEVADISRISREMVSCHDYNSFALLMDEHEKIMSSVLGIPPVGETIFRNFQGSVKSLGAWGGDFAMLLWPDDEKALATYLRSKNMDIYFRFSSILFDPRFNKR